MGASKKRTGASVGLRALVLSLWLFVGVAAGQFFGLVGLMFLDGLGIRASMEMEGAVLIVTGIAGAMVVLMVRWRRLGRR